jgi:hypothetical protein
MLDDNGHRLPILEHGNDWGDFLVIGAVEALED